jgi:hypothetical protein
VTEEKAAKKMNIEHPTFNIESRMGEDGKIKNVIQV